MFFALKGDSFDGNRYAADALEKGAAYAVVDDPSVAVSDRYIVVDDVLTTLQRLATYHRRVLGIPILAITGTNGKTTTKELVARVLAKRYNVAVTRGNLNNHIGVPLTLLSMKKGTEFGVVEMGAGARGEIEFLCNITLPDFGIITNVGRAHLEGFGGEEGVRQGKGELFDYLAAHHGIAFYCKEDPVLSDMAEERTKLLAKGYSVQGGATLKTALAGDYNRFNVAAAVAIGDHFGVTPKEIVAAIEGYVPDNHRSQRVETERNTLILDCYNANPSSMKAAIENFARERSSKEKVAILGDMLELGEYAADEHRKVVGLLAENGIKKVMLVGDNFAKAAAEAGMLSFGDRSELCNYLIKNQLSGNLILVKGSNGIGLDVLEGVL